jgi:hypothetical protein
MPRYYFIVRTPGRRYADRDGITMNGDHETLAYANRIANELASDGDCAGWSITVRDDAGRPVCAFPFYP